MGHRERSLPDIVDVPEMPVRRAGRPRRDLTPLVDAISDQQPHALEAVPAEDARRWRRKLRLAAQRVQMRVQTHYVREEARLYFQGGQR
jgi:hypothetical protein